MTRPTEDREFERFRRTGDPAALAAVFDACAPQLLRVAVHLVGEIAAGEDLVQGTFLEAMEHRDRWRPDLGVMPWLLGILSNLARRHRRPRPPIGDQAATPSDLEDPAVTAERREFRAELERAFDRVPTTFRDVVVLHLRHGLTAKEIAGALNRPRGTVRTQLVRGLEHLRRQLPTTLISGAALVVSTGPGLAAVRAELLRHADLAAAGAAAPGAATLGTSAAACGALALSMKKLLIPVAAAAVLAVLWAVLPPGSGPVAPPRAAAPAAAIRVAHNAEPAADATPLRRTANAARGAAAAGAASVPGPLAVTVRYSDGSPAANLRVARVDGPTADWTVEDETATDRDGVATFDELLGEIFVRTDRGTRVTQAVRAAAPGAVTIDLPPGLSVRGTVRDDLGRPVAGAEVFVLANDFPAPRALARSGPDGGYWVRDVEADRIEVWATQPGRQRSAVAVCVGGPGLTAREDLVLAANPAAITGLLLDRGGRPAADQPVYAVHRPGVGAPGAAVDWALRTDGAGRFALRDLPPGVVDVFAGDEHLGVARATLAATAGQTHDLTLRVPAGAHVVGQALDAAGRPGAGLFVILNWAGAELGHRDRTGLDRYAATGDDGRFALPGVLPGRYRLQVGTNGRRVETYLDVADGQRFEWNPVFEQGAVQRLLVVDSAGAPLPGWGVQWIEAPGAGEPEARGRIAGHAWVASDGSAAFHDLTVETGTLAFLEPVDRLDTFGVLGKLPSYSVAGVVRSEQTLRIVVPDDARARGSLRGRIVDHDGQPSVGTELHVWPSRWPTTLTSHLDATGHFALDGLPPGPYRIAAFRSDADWFETLGQVELDDGEVRDLGELRLVQRAALTVRVNGSDGAPREGARVRLSRDGDAAMRADPLRELEPGVYTADAVWPAAYELLIVGSGTAPRTERLELAPGQHVAMTVGLDAAPDQSIVIEFPVAGGPYLEGHYTVRTAQGRALFAEGFVEPHSPFDAARVCRTFGLAPGRYIVEATDASGRAARAEFRAFAGAAPVALSLR